MTIAPSMEFEACACGRCRFTAIAAEARAAGLLVTTVSAADRKEVEVYVHTAAAFVELLPSWGDPERIAALERWLEFREKQHLSVVKILRGPVRRWDRFASELRATLPSLPAACETAFA